AYGWVAWYFGSWIGRLVLFAYTWVLLHHMLGGLRHFVWDAGLGFEKALRMGLARLTLIGSLGLTVIVWALALILR
uniref:succinate dehydrogenase, cytochrome b556 subunit n=1 Tax=Acinetobacter pittii TaxID=48296 RepID=UPI00207C8740